MKSRPLPFPEGHIAWRAEIFSAIIKKFFPGFQGLNSPYLRAWLCPFFVYNDDPKAGYGGLLGHENSTPWEQGNAWQ
jgi:hypothetical protein